jgi:CheY-like chemotaxis protein
LRILLAEDQPTNKRVAQLLLSRLGYSCTTVSDGFEVIDAVSRQAFDVILLDVQMPRLDGIATTHRLCTDYPIATRPWIIALTANAMKGDRETCIAAGMDDYLAKPIGAKPLAEVLTRASQQLLLRR